MRNTRKYADPAAAIRNPTISPIITGVNGLSAMATVYARRGIFTSMTGWSSLRTVAVLVAIIALGPADRASAVPAFDMGNVPPGHEIAVFAGGCFWCMQPPFDPLPGVHDTIVGYTGGALENPTYRMVSWTETGHYESVLVIYDPLQVGYRDLLRAFWVNINPLDATGQFCDRGTSYRSAVFAATPAQARIAGESLRALIQSGWADQFDRPIATPVIPLDTFWVAEDYHQDYARRRPFSYGYYRSRCGRDARLRILWGPEESRDQRIRDLLDEPVTDSRSGGDDSVAPPEER